MTASVPEVGPIVAGREREVLDEIVGEAIGRSQRNRQTRRRIPGGGKLFVDGRSPFLALYRAPAGAADPGGARFARALRSHLVLPAGREHVARHVVGALGRAFADDLGVALLLELWVDPPGGVPERAAPRVDVRVVEGDRAVGAPFREALAGIRVLPSNEVEEDMDLAQVTETVVSEAAAPGLESVLPDDALSGNLHWVGIGIPGTFRDADSVYPARMFLLLRNITFALEEALHAWALPRMRIDLERGRHAFGRQNLGRTARAIDGRLAAVADSFDLVLGVSPLHSGRLWGDFQSGGEAVAPRFEYRPLHFDPEALKRALFHVPLERIEDPLVAELIREKQDELDLRISMLRSRGREDFFLGSLQLFGAPDDALVGLAREMLARSPESHEEDADRSDRADPIDAAAFARRAREEIEGYRRGHADFPSAIELRDDITSGLLVSAGTLCIRRSLCIDPLRADALLQHEVGTHVLTYFNGTKQPLRLLASGLAYYGCLQEGLAVLSEHLVGGLTRARLRTLAARVVAVEARVDEADFVEAYRLLVDLGVRPRVAFSVVVRVYRGGGLTKDALYLEGLRDILTYLRADGPIETLFIGKVGFSHLGIVRELSARGIAAPPAVLPRYVRDDAALRRLDECRDRTVLQLFEDARP